MVPSCLKGLFHPDIRWEAAFRGDPICASILTDYQFHGARAADHRNSLHEVKEYVGQEALVVCAQVPPALAKANKKVVRSMSSTSIQVQEGTCGSQTCASTYWYSKMDLRGTEQRPGLEFCLQWRDTRLEACTEADIQDLKSC